VIAREGWTRIAIVAGVAAVMHSLAALVRISLVACLRAGYSVFREPKRIIPTQTGIVVAPAHGRVVSIGLDPAKIRLAAPRQYKSASS
jgi:hypothetical protein